MTRFNALADREGFVVVYPEGRGRLWNDGAVVGGTILDRLAQRPAATGASQRLPRNVDDVGFLRALAARLPAHGVVPDRGRIFAAGMSNGGFMAMRLACEAADLFAGIAAVAATMSSVNGPACRPARRVAVLTVNGTADKIVPYEGGRLTFGQWKGAPIWSSDRALRFWGLANGCRGAYETVDLPDRFPADGTDAIRVRATSCAGAAVEHYRIVAGGHTWPGMAGPDEWPGLGRVSREIDASATIWRFFAAVKPRS
jgi:polyhydroxybutyrate depolymerase